MFNHLKKQPAQPSYAAQRVAPATRKRYDMPKYEKPSVVIARELANLTGPNWVGYAFALFVAAFLGFTFWGLVDAGIADALASLHSVSDVIENAPRPLTNQ